MKCEEDDYEAPNLRKAETCNNCPECVGEWGNEYWCYKYGFYTEVDNVCDFRTVQSIKEERR